MSVQWPDRIECHNHAHPAPMNPPAWEARRSSREHCSYCGSMNPRELLEAMADITPVRNPVFDEPHYPEGTTLAEFEASQEQWRERCRAWAGMDWADWKYGYPHKLYVHLPLTSDQPRLDVKFYSAHLDDLDGEAFAALSDLIARHTGVRFERDEQGRLAYRVAQRSES